MIATKRHRSFQLVPILTAIVLAASHAGAEPAGPAVRWIPYQSEHLHFSTKLPGDWSVRATEKAVGFTSPELPMGGHGAFGILKSMESGMTIEQAADKQFEHEGKPADWVRQPARFAGARALKIIGSSNKTPGIKMVQYYVEAPDNGYYVVQCMAPQEMWGQFSPLFATMISHFAFTQ